MKSNILKIVIILLATFSLGIVSSCINDKDYETPQSNIVTFEKAVIFPSNDPFMMADPTSTSALTDADSVIISSSREKISPVNCPDILAVPVKDIRPSMAQPSSTIADIICVSIN